MSAAKKADRIRIFFMFKSPRELECGQNAQRGIIHGRIALPSDNNERKMQLPTQPWLIAATRLAALAKARDGQL
jgi:hypothetical protein